VYVSPCKGWAPGLAALDLSTDPASQLSFCRPLQDPSRQNDISQRWLSLQPEIKQQVKQQALQTLGSPVGRAGAFAAQVVAAIAAVDLPAGQWPELIGYLLQFVNDASNAGLRGSSLQAIGFICEAVVRLFYPSPRAAAEERFADTRFWRNASLFAPPRRSPRSWRASRTTS
jgi:hypothetical protein